MFCSFWAGRLHDGELVLLLCVRLLWDSDGIYVRIAEWRSGGLALRVLGHRNSRVTESSGRVGLADITMLSDRAFLNSFAFVFSRHTRCAR